MAIDTEQKRFSAINPGCPWRGVNVWAPDTGFTRGNRAAGAYLYGLAVAVVVGGPVGCVLATDIYSDGMASGQAYTDGGAAQQQYNDGVSESQQYTDGADAGQLHTDGDVESQAGCC